MELPLDKRPQLPSSRSEAPIMPPTLWLTYQVHGQATGSPHQILFHSIPRLPPKTWPHRFPVGDTLPHSCCVEARSLSRLARHGYRDGRTHGITTRLRQSEKRTALPGPPNKPPSLDFGTKALHSVGAESPGCWRNLITWTPGKRRVCSPLSTSRWPTGSSPDSRQSMNSISGAR